ncbi:MAG: 50S ribosomal protein L31 [Candidatus Sumerlaeota bacterium]
MKKGMHPEVGLVLYRCASCSNKWLTTSTKLEGGRVEELEGKEYPAIVLETCSSCHPFYTGQQTYIDTAGRVEKFNKRFAKFQQPEEKKEEKETVESK